MNRGRILGLVALLAVLGGLTTTWAGRGATAPKHVTGPSVAHVGLADDVSSTWFCTAGGAPGDPKPHHQLYITNTGGSPAEVRVTAHGTKGVVGSKELAIGVRSTAFLDVDQTFSASDLSAMVESPAGAIAVTHWILSGAVGDAEPCQREPSPTWYFPSQTTLTGTTAQLVLFNPFSSDAGVDVSAAVVDGIRTPPEWAGIVVPSGTTKVIDLAAQVQRRDQFSLTVKVRSGGVFAETVQTFDGVAIGSSPSVSGLQLTGPAREPRPVWTFAGGFKDSGATELLVVQNPSREAVTVRVQVAPNGAGELLPEPFEVRVQPLRYAVLDLTEEGRVPDVGFHSITVESDQLHPVVVERQIRLSAAPTSTAADGADAAEGADAAPGDASTASPTRVNLAKGVAGGTGVGGSARRWWLPGMITGGTNAPLAFVHNPGDEPAEVKVSATDATGAMATVVSGLTVAAGDSVTIMLSPEKAAARTVRSFRFDASAPVVVEGLTTMNTIPDFAIAPGFPSGR